MSIFQDHSSIIEFNCRKSEEINRISRSPRSEANEQRRILISTNKDLVVSNSSCESSGFFKDEGDDHAEEDDERVTSLPPKLIVKKIEEEAISPKAVAKISEYSSSDDTDELEDLFRAATLKNSATRKQRRKTVVRASEIFKTGTGSQHITGKLDFVNFKVKAIFKYNAKTPNQLTFKRGDIVVLTEDPEDENPFWKGYLQDDEEKQEAEFPAKYVKPFD